MVQEVLKQKQTERCEWRVEGEWRVLSQYDLKKPRDFVYTKDKTSPKKQVNDKRWTLWGGREVTEEDGRKSGEECVVKKGF